MSDTRTQEEVSALSDADLRSGGGGSDEGGGEMSAKTGKKRSAEPLPEPCRACGGAGTIRWRFGSGTEVHRCHKCFPEDAEAKEAWDRWMRWD